MGCGLDIYDEVDAFVLQGLLDKTSLPDELLQKNEKNITPETVKNIYEQGENNKGYKYENLPKKHLDKNSVNSKDCIFKNE